MSRHRILLSLLVAGLLPALLAAHRAGATLDVQPESRLWVSGTSTVKAFQCQATLFEAKVESGAGAVTAVLAGDKAVAAVEVIVPVERLDCRNDTMNEHLRKALKAGAHPTIVFRAATYDLVRSDEGVAVTLTGTLRLGGVEKPITVLAQGKPGAQGRLVVFGTQVVRMTEFGLKPPSLMLGTMRVGDRITVGFEIVLKD